MANVPLSVLLESGRPLRFGSLLVFYPLRLLSSFGAVDNSDGIATALIVLFQSLLNIVDAWYSTRLYLCVHGRHRSIYDLLPPSFKTVPPNIFSQEAFLIQNR